MKIARLPPRWGVQIGMIARGGEQRLQEQLRFFCSPPAISSLGIVWINLAATRESLFFAWDFLRRLSSTEGEEERRANIEEKGGREGRGKGNTSWERREREPIPRPRHPFATMSIKILFSPSVKATLSDQRETQRLIWRKGRNLRDIYSFIHSQNSMFSYVTNVTLASLFPLRGRKKDAFVEMRRAHHHA